VAIKQRGELISEIEPIGRLTLPESAIDYPCLVRGPMRSRYPLSLAGSRGGLAPPAMQNRKRTEWPERTLIVLISAVGRRRAYGVDRGSHGFVGNAGIQLLSEQGCNTAGSMDNFMDLCSLRQLL